MTYLWCFLIGGGICVIGELLILLTKLTPARILVIYIVAGVILSFCGLYRPIVELAGAGATVPLTGFGYALWEGTRKAIEEQGAIGILTGGLGATAGGIAAAIVFGFITALITEPKAKHE
ncbi:MAG: stage V sporulation protein AE [Eubacteriales bacterium]|nr:stage V sporulation protein AE [Eubacteriales bacterium]MDD3881572.1 stage V sporulation protein AE [Eubacteriales bacterium]MDD4513358.1 stage V sporulation protein AE [Eubacteriales bacterium]